MAIYRSRPFGAGLDPDLPTKPPQPSDEAQGGAIGMAAAKAACAAAGGTWNDLTGQCIQVLQPIIDAVEQQSKQDICTKTGGTWDPAAGECKKAPSISDLAPWGALALGIGAGWFLVSSMGKRRRS